MSRTCSASASTNAGAGRHSPTLAWSPRDTGADASSCHDSRPDRRALPEALAW